jgi:2-polyprenyl-3-methyl-5-hydroxy-6-metoxy-1,4-benzoquinol methylase
MTGSAAIHRKCPVCDHDSATQLLIKKDVSLVRCQDCRMIYANPVEGELASGTFYDRRGTSFYLSPEKLESDYSPVRFARELRLFRRLCAGGNVLDVGCSTGAFLYQLSTRFPGDYEVTGIDVTSAALDYAESRGVAVCRGSFLELPETDRKFDAITFWAVIEHLVHPKLFLQKTERLLKPNGLCFILVPNMRSLAVRILGGKYRYIMPDHVNYFTPRTLSNFGKSVAGLEELTFTSMHFNPVVILQDFRSDGQERVADEARAKLLKRTTAWKQSARLGPLKFAYSGLEKVLGAARLADNIVLVLRKIPQRS